MRYFRNLGVDAHLLLYSNEGFNDSNPIHSPEWDTWEYEKWKPYIHRLPITHGIQSIVGRPDLFISRPSKIELFEIFDKFDKYIGSGITPAIFARINKKLDIFYPHSLGVEWVGDEGTIKFLNKYNFQWPFRWYVRRMQVLGIRSAKNTINASMDHTKVVLDSYSVKFKIMYIPQVYNLESIPFIIDDNLINLLSKRLSKSKLNVFSQMRHFWGNKGDTKNTDWLIIGFSKFLKLIPSSNARLILVEWGDDVTKSKELCEQLGINSNVIWLPLLKRRQVLWILNYITDVSAGQFNTTSGQIWASTGWEALAMGVPLMQSVNFSKEEYEIIFKHKLPYILDVKSPKDIFYNLLNVYNNKFLIKELSKVNREWFNKYNGIGLANNWLSLL